jgi:hypothetical protein
MSKTTQPRERPSVFVGSSTEGISVAKAVQLGLDQSCEVEVWNQGAFGLSEGTLESLVASANRFDFAVLALSADDLMVSRGELRASARDNVLFELGLFIGRLGRERTFIVYDRANPPQLPSDLAGITAATFQPHGSGNIAAAVGAACTKIEQVISRLGPRAGSGLSRLSQATQTFQDLSSDAQQLLRLLARSRAVELDIIAEQFGAFIQPDKLNLIRRDLVDLEEKVSKRSFEQLSELARELLSAGASTGSIHVLKSAFQNSLTTLLYSVAGLGTVGHVSRRGRRRYLGATRAIDPGTPRATRAPAWAYADSRSRHPDGRPVRIAVRDSLADVAEANGVRVWEHVLATVGPVAARGRVAAAA